MNIETILKLAQDRPQHTPEIQKPNDFYGHAHLLKKYCGLPANHSLKVVAEHAVYLKDPVSFIWEAEANSPMPVFLCANPAHAEHVAAVTGKKAFAIGPWLAYATNKSIEEDRAARPADTQVLVVPTHSSHLVDVHYDVDDFMRRVLSEYKGCSVTVLLYWKDILKGLHEQYMRYDVKLATAGHIFDPGFLPRLRWILGNSSCMVTNCAGTHLLYSVLLRRPVWHIDQDVRYYGTLPNTNDAPKSYRASLCETQSRLHAMFAKPLPEVSAEQGEFIDGLLGVDCLKTPQQLREIVLLGEKLFMLIQDAMEKRRSAEQVAHRGRGT